MAKMSKSLCFKNAVIDYENDIIMEISKDDTKSYVLSKILKEWDKIEGLNLTFKKDDELASEDVDIENKDEFGEDE